MQIMLISRERLLDLLELQQRNTPFNFSCNPKREVWPTPGRSYTYEKDRDYVQGVYPELDQIVDIVVRERYGAGRFYLSRDGAFFSHNHRQFAEFEIVD